MCSLQTSTLERCACVTNSQESDSFQKRQVLSKFGNNNNVALFKKYIISLYLDVTRQFFYGMSETQISREINGVCHLEKAKLKRVLLSWFLCCPAVFLRFRLYVSCAVSQAAFSSIRLQENFFRCCHVFFS